MATENVSVQTLPLPIIKDFWSLIIFAKGSIRDVRLGSQHDPVKSALNSLEQRQLQPV